MTDIAADVAASDALPPILAEAPVVFDLSGNGRESAALEHGSVDPEVEASAPPGWPELSDEALYGVLGKVARLATANSEADPAAVFMTAITWAGALIGAKVHTKVGETQHPPRFFSVLVGASSRARKGTSEAPVRRIFDRVETLLQADSPGYCPLRVTPGPLSSGEGLVYNVRDDSDDQDENGSPKVSGVEDKRLLVLDGEFGGALKAMQREGNTVSAILRTAWDSGSIAPMTRHNRIKATGAHINCVGHITVAELNRLLSDTDVRNGLANRILWTCVRRTRLVPLPGEMSASEVDSVAKRIAQAVVFTQTVTSVPLTSQAELMWSEIYPSLSADRPGAYGDTTSRAEAQVRRLALLFALLDQAREVDVVHLRTALAVWEYCDASARFLFGGQDEDPVVTKLLAALASGEMTQTEVNDLFGGHIPAKAIRGVLLNLQAMGVIVQRKDRGGRISGPYTTFWRLAKYSPKVAD